jgi:hypothetical protein
MRIPAGYGQANIVFTGGAVPQGAEVTFGFMPTGLNVGDAARSALTIGNQLGTSTIMANLSSLVVATAVRVKLGPNLDGPYHERIINIPGSIVSSTVTPNVAVLVRKNTVLGGRRNRGRFYWPGLRETDVDEAGFVLTTRRTDLQADFDAFLSGLTLADITPVVLHGEAQGELAPVPIASFSVDPRVATQRRRLR